ncbi:hypothetical protein COL5a_010925 [Colletotrichum fioriniae]|uniref:Hsp70 chaperone n=1 Tax=Colletotrichum fioriniae TaxID=710243 RepID=UPI0032DA3F7F|nr:hypothetical protein COL5a_010925 [Colletotrichum fioriniae]KAJ3950514.1 Hsp70 chaperone [Colletotrichum fioriniae]
MSMISPTLSVLSVFVVVRAAKNQVAMNSHNNVVFDAKCLIGREFQDSEGPWTVHCNDCVR